MTAPGPVRPSGAPQVALRRTRARRVVAFAGMLTTIAGLVGVRAALAPAPTQALGATGLAAEAGTKATAGSSSSTRHPVGGSSPSAPHPTAGGGRARGKHVVVGKPYDVTYGIVRVKVTMTGTRITDVRAMSLPRGGHSSDISRYAAPELRREALSAQSAHIDSVSGASYTSAGYARSLQSALDHSRR